MLRLLAIFFMLVSTAFSWEVLERKDVPYVSLEEIRSFYKFPTIKRVDGYTQAGNAEHTLKLKPYLHELFIDDIRFELLHPVFSDRKQGLLISVLDLKKIVDPILRPAYINNRQVPMTIVLDPGHGGADFGAQNPILKESELNLLLAKKIQARLEKLGFKVVLTREDERLLTDKQRISIANKHSNAVFVGIHHNEGRNSESGISCHLFAPAESLASISESSKSGAKHSANEQDALNILLAGRVYTHLIQDTGAKQRGVQHGDFPALAPLKMPAIMVSCGFISHPTELILLKGEKYQNVLADSIAKAIQEYAELMKNKPEQAPVTP